MISRYLQIFDGVRPEIISPLRDDILHRAANERSRGSNNVGGWKSDINFFDSNVLAIRKLHAELFARIGGYPIGWAMVNRAGSYHKRHSHGLQYTCGIYYVSSGDPAVPTIFEVNNGMIEQEVSPTPGRLVIFPGGMFHRVPIYKGASSRITIAFELRP